MHPFVFALGTFLLGWLLASISQRISAKVESRDRDPRDARIRALEAELNVSRKDNECLKADVARRDEDLAEAIPGIASRDTTIAQQKSTIDQLRLDLTSSVRKVRKLRAELADRAAENVHAKAKIREVETELSIVQASTDLISTGVLNYVDDDDDVLASKSEVDVY